MGKKREKGMIMEEVQEENRSEKGVYSLYAFARTGSFSYDF